MKIEKIFSLFFSFFIFSGCAANLCQNGPASEPEEKTAKKEFNPLKTIIIWNEENLPVNFILKRDDGKIKKVKISAQKTLQINLEKGGEYSFYYYAYDPEFNKYAEKEGKFDISRNNKIKEYRGELAAHHIKIENLRWKKERMKKVLDINGIPGEIRYGRNQDQIIFETPAGNVRGIFSGGPALIFRKITGKNRRGGE